MHEQFLGLQSIPEIRALQPKARDYIELCDWPGFVAHARNVGMGAFANRLETGDEIVGQAIDERASAIEAGLLLTTGLVARNSVCGACPNVPAYIMGNPYNMRDRRRDKTGRGPLALFIEMTGSGRLDHDEMIERGAALYAMVRALALFRPLELWITTTYGTTGMMCQTAIRVETNPLDLARAAMVLTSYNDIAATGSITTTRMKNWRDVRCSMLGWAYGVDSLERKYAGEILGRMISPGSQIAYLPAGLLGTDNFSDPEGWIRKMLREYSPYLLSGDDREDTETGD